MSCFTCLQTTNKNTKSNRFIIPILGLDNAGKSSFILRLQNDDISHPPLNSGWGFSVHKFSFNTIPLSLQKRKCPKNVPLTLYDIGGHYKIRGIWSNYYQESDGFVYMIDASDGNRIHESIHVFKDFINHPSVMGKPVLIVCNKTDVNESKSVSEIFDQLSKELQQLQETYYSNEFDLTRPIKWISTFTSIGGSSESTFKCNNNTIQKQVIDTRIQSGMQWLIQSIKTKKTKTKFIKPKPNQIGIEAN